MCLQKLGRNFSSLFIVIKRIINSTFQLNKKISYRRFLLFVLLTFCLFVCLFNCYQAMNAATTTHSTNVIEPQTISVTTLWSVTPTYPVAGTGWLAAQGLLCRHIACPKCIVVLCHLAGWMANIQLKGRVWCSAWFVLQRITIVVTGIVWC